MSITYTEELQGSINNSNNQFIQEEYDLDHANNAAKISLYHAHGETEKNAINYRNAKIDQKKALTIDGQAVQGVNLAGNAQTAAKQSLVDAGKATSNISTAAANMQIAANAITKLSSDVAGILAVANAADHGSQIQSSVERAHKKTRKAAKLAEEVSLISMTATIEAAQSTASTVVTDSQEALAAVTNFQKSTAAQYTTVSERVVAGNESLTEARKNEKAAAGLFDIAKKQDKAIKSTRKLINQVSNYDLRVFDPALEKNNVEEKQSWVVDAGKSYTISFNKFEGDGTSNSDPSDTAEQAYVKDYRLIMVKYDAAKAFDINVAKDLQPGTYHQISAKGFSKYARTFYLLGTDQALIPHDPSLTEQKDPTTLDRLDSKNVRGIAVDYLGKPIEAGEFYVAFVHANYSDEYQSLISNTDGFLSLASKEVQLQMDLPKIPSHRIEKTKENNKNLVIKNATELTSRNLAVKFEVKQKDYDPKEMEYRVMLVEKRNVDAQKLNKKVQSTLDKLDRAEMRFNAEKQTLQTMTQGLNQLEVKFNALQTLVEEKLALQIDVTDKTPAYLKEQQVGISNDLKDLRAKLKNNRDAQKKLESAIYGDENLEGQQSIASKAEQDYQEALKSETNWSTKKVEKNVSDFIFDEELMNSVSAANYTAATPFNWTEDSAKDKLKETRENLKLAQLKATDAIKDYALYNFELTEAQNAVKFANNDVNEMKTALSAAETALDLAEMKKEDLKEPIKALNKARLNLQNAQSDLHSKELALEVVESNRSVGVLGLQALLDKYVTASSKQKRATEILDEAKGLKKANRGRSASEEIVLFYTEVGEDATDNYGEPLQFNDIGNWKTTLDIFENIWKEEAKKLEPFQDLSEKLQQSIEDHMNHENLLETAIKAVQEVYADLIDANLITSYLKRILRSIEAGIKSEIDEEKLLIITEKVLRAILTAILEYMVDQEADKIPREVCTTYLEQEKSSKPNVSYQAVVLTTIISGHEETVAQYRLQSSHYSHHQALWGVVE